MEPGGVILQYESEEAKRLDRFLAACLHGYSRSRIQRWIKDGLVSVNGRIVEKTGFPLEGTATIKVMIPDTQESDLIPEDIPLDVIHEDDNVLVVNKPAGMVVHPSPGHAAGTLVHAALAHAPEMEGVGGVRRPGVVHRLDKDTSGCILLAKNDTTHRWLQRQFRAREVEKIYHALVDGRPPTPKGRIEAAIGRDSTHRIKMSVVVPEKGRRAVTEYTTVETFERYSYLEVRPITGRTHQIRVHLAFLGCPVSGDRVYGGRRSSVPLERQFLHASLLRIRLLGDETHRTFQAALAPELAGFLADLRASGSSPPHV